MSVNNVHAFIILFTEQAENPAKSRQNSKQFCIMTFNGKEMAALLKAAKMMALADGNMTSDEKEVMVVDLKSFGVQLDTLQSVAIEHQANSMEGAEVISVLSNLSMEQKKYACGYLAAVMAADGNIDEKELELWSFISLLAGFPRMNIDEAISFWQSH